MKATLTITVLKKETMTVQDITSGTWPDPVGGYIYIVRDVVDSVTLYVGKTFPSLRKRFLQHINKGSKIGRLMHPDNPYSARLMVTAIRIDGLDSFAEMDLIERYGPLLNKQRKQSPMEIVWVGLQD